jgi:hypothetical protein
MPLAYILRCPPLSNLAASKSQQHLSSPLNNTSATPQQHLSNTSATSATMVSQTQKQWTLQGKNGVDSLIYNEDAPIPKIGETEVLVKCEYTREVSGNDSFTPHPGATKRDSNILEQSMGLPSTTEISLSRSRVVTQYLPKMASCRALMVLARLSKLDPR